MDFRDNLWETLDYYIGMGQKELAAKTGLSLKTIEKYVKKDSSLPVADKAVLELIRE
jgi:transcriptional regulator with XRE-family HTH domain